MQVTETVSDGLKREYRVVVPAADLETRLSERLSEIKDRVRLNGFRPGKVPVSHLKRVYGKAVMAEAIEAIVRETNSKIVSDHGYKLAMEPQVQLPTGEQEIEGVISGKSDLAYTVALEIVPKIELANFKGIKLERWTTDITQQQVDDAIKLIAEQNKPFVPKGEGAKVENGDRVVMKFAGTMDGQPFEGGSGDDIPVMIGAGQFIPGFEEQLIGMAAGETKTVNVTFPPNYSAANLAGKPAAFEVTAKSIEAPGAVSVDEAFAKSLGMESLEKLTDAVKERVQRANESTSRQRLKRQLLDRLDELHKFDPPPTLLEEEFNNVWTTVESDLKERGSSFEAEGTTEEKARAEYRAIAERRVRLGLVLAEIGERNQITVSDDELTRALVERARQVPGREQEIWNYYRSNPSALATLRAPLYEEKVVDFLIELAEVTEKKVSREELYKDDDDSQVGKASA
jgi:trigger factor